jgi:hypothetical protein
MKGSYCAASWLISRTISQLPSFSYPGCGAPHDLDQAESEWPNSSEKALSAVTICGCWQIKTIFTDLWILSALSHATL